MDDIDVYCGWDANAISTAHYTVNQNPLAGRVKEVWQSCNLAMVLILFLFSGGGWEPLGNAADPELLQLPKLLEAEHDCGGGLGQG